MVCVHAEREEDHIVDLDRNKESALWGLAVLTGLLVVLMPWIRYVNSTELFVNTYTWGNQIIGEILETALATLSVLVFVRVLKELIWYKQYDGRRPNLNWADRFGVWSMYFVVIGGSAISMERATIYHADGHSSFLNFDDYSLRGSFVYLLVPFACTFVAAWRVFRIQHNNLIDHDPDHLAAIPAVDSNLTDTARELGHAGFDEGTVTELRRRPTGTDPQLP